MATPSLPRAHDLNVLVVERLPEEVDAAALIAAADHLQADLHHRKVVVLVDGAGERLAEDFAAAGWEIQRQVAMVHRRSPDRPAEPGLAEQVAPPVARRGHELGLQAQGADPETIRQILDMRERVAAGVERTTFAAFADGRPAALADLLAWGGTGQIEDVATLPDHRGRGLARAVVLAALDASRAAGHDLTLIVADEEDWPAAFYGRLGFDPVARLHQFLRI